MKVGLNLLQPGDILAFRVTESSNWLDKLIVWGQHVIHQAPTDADYCHVALVGPDPAHYYEATWPRLTNTFLDIQKIQRSIVLEAYRVTDITPEQVANVLDYARAQVGRRYDWLAMLTLGLIQLGPAAVCSQYVWESFTAAGICLCPFADLESPDNIAASSRLERIF